MGNSGDGKREGGGGSRAGMWGCIGTVTAAVVTGIFTLLASGTLPNLLGDPTTDVIDPPQVTRVQSLEGLQPGGASGGAVATVEPVATR